MILKTELYQERIELDGATFVCRELSTAQMTELSIVASKEGGGAAVEERFVMTVKEWNGVESKEGPFDCNDVNKRIAIQANPKLTSVLEKFDTVIEAKQKEEKKI